MAKIRSFQPGDRHIRRALAAAARADPDVAAALEQYGFPPARRQSQGLIALLYWMEANSPKPGNAPG